MKKLLIALLLLPLIALANPIDDKCPQFVLRGAPISQLTNTQYICKTNYAIHYRYDTKTPEYVVEHVTKAAITGPAKRKDDFRPDPAIPVTAQSQLSDYAGFPYDRGHLVPAGDNTQNDLIMSESFFLSNMVPQVANNNRGIWKQAETFERQWAATPGTNYFIISGGIYDANSQKIGSGLTIPTRLYKIVIEKNSRKVEAWLMPNAPLPVADLPKYQTNMTAIEQATGMRFNLGQ